MAWKVLQFNGYVAYVQIQYQPSVMRFGVYLLRLAIAEGTPPIKYLILFFSSSSTPPPLRYF